MEKENIIFDEKRVSQDEAITQTKPRIGYFSKRQTLYLSSVLLLIHCKIYPNQIHLSPLIELL